MEPEFSFFLLLLFAALGVSGGPDSIALCVLASGWKANGMVGADDRSGWIDGILGIVVDHGLRAESGEEAKQVCVWVSKMGNNVIQWQQARFKNSVSSLCNL